MFALDKGEHWDEVPPVVDLWSKEEVRLCLEIRRDLVIKNLF